MYDGTVREISRRNGVRKQKRMVFKDGRSHGEIEKMGWIFRANEQEVLLEVKTNDDAPVASEPPLEDIIELLYMCP